MQLPHTAPVHCSVQSKSSSGSEIIPQEPASSVPPFPIYLRRRRDAHWTHPLHACCYASCLCASGLPRDQRESLVCLRWWLATTPSIHPPIHPLERNMAVGSLQAARFRAPSPHMAFWGGPAGPLTAWRHGPARIHDGQHRQGTWRARDSRGTKFLQAHWPASRCQGFSTAQRGPPPGARKPGHHHQQTNEREAL